MVPVLTGLLRMCLRKHMPPTVDDHVTNTTFHQHGSNTFMHWHKLMLSSRLLGAMPWAPTKYWTSNEVPICLSGRSFRCCGHLIACKLVAWRWLPRAGNKRPQRLKLGQLQTFSFVVYNATSLHGTAGYPTALKIHLSTWKDKSCTW